MSSKFITETELTMLIKQLDVELLETDSPPPSSEESESATLGQSDGWIRVENNRIIVVDPQPGGKRPIIQAEPPLKLRINGKETKGPQPVSSNDRIEFEIVEEPLFRFTVSEDKLHAYFHLRSRERYAWKLVDQPAAFQVTLKAEEDRSTVLETVHLSDVISALMQQSIKSHLDIAAIHRELVEQTGEPVLIATGRPPVAGEDAKLELYFSEHVESQFFEIAGTVDFRNHLHIPSVKRGDVIARKTPMSDGVPGYDVYGNVILPPAPKDIYVVAKESVEIRPDGAIVALKEGRPRVTGDKIKCFDISTSYVVPGNVDIETGNIVFSGDVVIYGNVTDTMIVESLGNVYVFGSVFNSTITATGSIYIKGNVIGSRLYSGYYGVMFNRLYHSSKTLSEQIDKLLAASQMLLKMLESRKQPAKFGQIVLLLLENKFKDIPNVIKELLFVLSNIRHMVGDDIKKLQQYSNYFLQPTRLVNVSYNTLQSFKALLEETHQEVARMQEVDVQIRINQCHNSELKSNGDIIIHREGVLLSNLYSSDNIVFLYDSAVCRGSKLEAGGSIHAKIVGGQTGAPTVLTAKKSLSIKKMYAGRICVDRYCKDIYEPIENVKLDVAAMRQLIRNDIAALRKKNGNGD